MTEARMPISRNMLDAGDVVPWFEAPVLNGPQDFRIDRMGGRHILMLFCGSTVQPAVAAALHLAEARSALFGRREAIFLGVTIDPADPGRLGGSKLRFLLDFDTRVSTACGAAARADGKATYQPHWLLIGPALRVIERFALDQGGAALEAFERAVATPQDLAAPALIVPEIFEPALCRTLIDLYDRHGGVVSGFMQQVGDKTIGVRDPQYKKRSDYQIEDEAVRQAIRDRLTRRLVPLIHRSFQFQVTRIERYIVACYDGAEGGHFAAHRDNTTAATAHRRFAVTINLNGDYEGGDLRFPEFGPRTYRAPVGGAVVFSCSLMHEATPVTAGRRYATLPFLYDDAAAEIRRVNRDALVLETTDAVVAATG